MAKRTITLNINDFKLVENGVAIQETENSYVIVVSKKAKVETAAFTNSKGQDIPASSYIGTKSKKYASKTEDKTLGVTVAIKKYDVEPAKPQEAIALGF